MLQHICDFFLYQWRAHYSVKTTQSFFLEMNQRPKNQEPIKVASQSLLTIGIYKKIFCYSVADTDTETKILLSTLRCLAVPFCRTMRAQYFNWLKLKTRKKRNLAWSHTFSTHSGSAENKVSRTICCYLVLLVSINTAPVVLYSWYFCHQCVSTIIAELYLNFSQDF